VEAVVEGQELGERVVAVGVRDLLEFAQELDCRCWRKRRGPRRRTPRAAWRAQPAPQNTISTHLEEGNIKARSTKAMHQTCAGGGGGEG
jgi:hypothetical protein